MPASSVVQMRSSSSSVMASGGMITSTLPSGRSSTPCSRAAVADVAARVSLPRDRARAVARSRTSSIAADQAALPHVADVRMLGDPRQVLGQPRDLGRQVRERLLFFEHVERGQRHGAPSGLPP